MRTEIKEAKTYYISDDGIYYTDKWDCIQHENWIKEDNRRINLQERWNKLINSLPMKQGECPVYHKVEYTGNFPMILVMETNTELYMADLEKSHVRLCTLDHIKSETLWYWKEMGYDITITKKDNQEEQ